MTVTKGVRSAGVTAALLALIVALLLIAGCKSSGMAVTSRGQLLAIRIVSSGNFAETGEGHVDVVLLNKGINTVSDVLAEVELPPVFVVLDVVAPAVRSVTPNAERRSYLIELDTIPPAESVVIRFRVRTSFGSMPEAATVIATAWQAGLPGDKVSETEDISLREDSGVTHEVTWNAWVEERDVLRPSRMQRLKTNDTYNFVVDLAPIAYKLTPSGRKEPVLSVEPGPELRASLSDAASKGKTVVRVFLRPVLLGSLAFATGRLRAEVWQNARWERIESDEMIPIEIDTAKLGSAYILESETFDQLGARMRAGGLRFAFKAASVGCFAIAVSIWNEDRTIPLDNIVYPVAVESPCGSGADAPYHKPGITTLLVQTGEARYDAALQLFDFSLRRATPGGTVAVYVPQTQTDACTHYVWQTSRPLTSYFGTASFKNALAIARRGGAYGVLAKALRDEMFPSGDQTACGASAAFAHLSQMAAAKPPSLFLSVVNLANELLFAPIGPLFLVREAATTSRSFAHTPVLSQPLPGYRYGQSRCIEDVAYAIPAFLHRFGSTFEPESTKGADVLRDLDGFRKFMLEVDAPDPEPTLFVLLAHHGDGTIYFDDERDSWHFSEISRTFQRGSVAVLAVCAAGDLRDPALPLVRALNARGVDAIVMSSFDLVDEVGVELTRQFAISIAASRAKGANDTIEVIFRRARAKTLEALTESRRFTREDAEGHLSEVFLAGNGRLQLCGGR